MNPDTYVIVPAYNEAQTIEKVVKELLKHFKNVVCVNDGSKDDTKKIINKSGATAIHHPINLGQGAAIQTGVEHALSKKDAKYFITYDADGQHNIKDTIKMLECLKKDDLDIVIGSRFLGKSENMSSAKKTFLKAAIVFSSVFTGVKLTDTHVGLRVFNRDFATNLNLTMNGMAHATEIIDRIRTHGYKYREMPITITYSDYSKAKGQSMLNSINIAAELFMNRIMKW